MEEERFEGSYDLDQMVMIRGKSTKRMRLSSPSDGTGVTLSSSSGGEEDFSSIWSVTTSSEVEDSTEEEEDMANCLILLAQGDGPKKRAKSGPRFDEMTQTTIAKASFCAYECKTCTRVFPSFQALGGHRASHKKPKHIPTSIAAIGEKVKKLSSFTDPDEPEEIKLKEKMYLNKGKLHECSICGLQFSSGQALGGHMRRHRAQAAAVVDEADPIRERTILQLDLNLPAPEDDLRDTIFHFPATPSPVLVDCYY